jgi:hypothetical protein
MLSLVREGNEIFLPSRKKEKADAVGWDFGLRQEMLW